MPDYTPLQQHAYDYLKEAIISEQLSPDEVYSESYFARKLNISRTPVRSALQRLSQEGYVDIFPSRGVIIHPLTETDITAMYQMRCAIESYCLIHFARDPDSRQTQELLAKLDASIARQKSCLDGNSAEYFTHDCEFHRLIVSQLNNPWFDEAFQKFVQQLRLMTKKTMTASERIKRSIHEHEQICQILRDGESTSVISWLLQHIAYPTQYMLEQIKNRA